MANTEIFNLFGSNERGFLNAIKHYSDVKAGYDGTISSYGADYSVRELAVVDDKGNPVKVGTVPVRENVSYEKKIETVLLEDDDVLGFKFFIPLKKGFQVSANVEFISWDGTEVLAKKTATGIYIQPDDLGNEPNPLNSDNSVNLDGLSINANEDDYAYLPITLTGDSGDNPDELLQAKILRWKAEPMDISRQLFILRVRQMVWPVNKAKSDLISEEYEVRNDSIIFEIKD